MISLSIIAVPVFLDTGPSPGMLYVQWARMYHYGHMVLPTLSILTATCYGYAAWLVRVQKQKWQLFAVAAVTTILMIPFTLLFMTPTNERLFALEKATRSIESTGQLGSLEEARVLIRRWSGLHIMRSLSPFVGAVLGSIGIRRTFESPLKQKF
nr:anthrone oxygenase gedh [Quercus suber]